MLLLLFHFRISLQEKALTAITKKLYPAFTKMMNFIKDVCEAFGSLFLHLFSTNDAVE